MKKLVCSYVTTRQTHEIWWIQDSFGKFIYIYKIYLKGQFYLKSIWTEEKVSQTIVTSLRISFHISKISRFYENVKSEGTFLSVTCPVVFQSDPPRPS